jgi:hypothetical protein
MSRSDRGPTVAALAAVERVFGPVEVVDVRPAGRTVCPAALARGPRMVGAYDRCGCGVGTWIRFGDAVLCPACAWAQWSQEQRAALRTAGGD